MDPINEQNSKDLERKIQAALSSNSEIHKLLDFLPNCEYELISYMVDKNVWKGPVPLPPDKFKKGAGSIEFGLFLYWFHNVGLLTLDGLDFKEKILIELIISLVVESGYLQNTKLNSNNYSYLQTNEIIYTDGTVLSTEKYATYDQGWFTAFINLFISLIHNLWYNEGSFPKEKPQPIKLEGASTDSVSIAIIGDWGAANEASNEVMNRIKSIKPDYIIHVGDVYYSGTPLKTDPLGEKYLFPGEEQQVLLDLWPKGYHGKSFTMNSNHEMYSGANGLFYDAYGVNNQNKTPFCAHNGASIFALEYAGWTLLGLDTAYNSPITTAFMTGSIGEASGTQNEWIQGLHLDPNKTIVLSHHNGFSHDCSKVSPLWGEINKALKGDPFAWYWGHVHNGIVYDQPLKLPFGEHTTPIFNTNTFARCLGHAALPYGMASSLQQVDIPVTYKANNPNPLKPKELYNGFAVLTLTSKSKNGQTQMSKITERFYDLSNESQPVYIKQLF